MYSQGQSPCVTYLLCYHTSCVTSALPSPRQVVHSRTFANAAPGGGVGVRMLVPLIDMMNHSGDEAQLASPAGEAAQQGHEGHDAVGLGGPVVAKDNVR